MVPLRDSKALLSPSARWADEGKPVPCALSMSRPKSKGRAISFQQRGRRLYLWLRYLTRWGRPWVFAPSYTKNWILLFVILDIFNAVQQLLMHSVWYHIWAMRPLQEKVWTDRNSVKWVSTSDKARCAGAKNLPVYFAYCCLYTGGCFSWHTAQETCTFNSPPGAALKELGLAALRRKPEYKPIWVVCQQ